VSDLPLPTTLAENPHRRFNALTGDWVLVSPHRTKRPWQGQVDRPAQDALPAHDPNCYLCPGASRAGGATNPAYDGAYVFDNDFPALFGPVPEASFDAAGLLRARAEQGLCRVVCFSPRHDLTLARMDAASIRRVVDVWTAQDAEIGARPEIGYVQIFENRGAMMGCSNAHPHGQIWSTETVPEERFVAPGTLASGWHHVAVTIDSATMTVDLYLDGAVVVSDSTTVLPKDLGETTQNWLGHSQWPDADYDGLMADVKIYSRALSAGEIRYLAGDR